MEWRNAHNIEQPHIVLFFLESLCVGNSIMPEPMGILRTCFFRRPTIDGDL